MTHAKRFGLTFLVLLAASVLVLAQEKRRGRTEFMREKLVHSKEILEGLTRADFSQIKKATAELKAMRESPEWPSMSRPVMTRYSFYTLEFEELLAQLDEKADEKNIEGSTLAYLSLTANCVNCHKELRAQDK